MTVNPYLHFNGDCAEAITFYEKSLGAKVVFKMTFGESPMAAQCPDAMKSTIMHATITVDGAPIMMCDAPGDKYHTPQGFAVSLNIKSPEEAEKIYAAMTDGATSIMMPIQETFWALRFGMFNDKFGIPWMINCEKPMA